MMKSLLATICLLALISCGCSKPGRYERSQGEWVWVWPDTLAGPGETQPLNVDDQSFRVLESDFACDEHKVFWKGRLILGAAPFSFEIISPSDYVPFSKDCDSVFIRGFEISGADPATFRIVEGAYSADSSNIYCGTTPINGADLNSFQVIYNAGIKRCDEELAESYFGVPIDTDVFAMAWSRDAENYYYGPVKVQDADYPTFKVLNAYEAEDKFGKFQGYLRVEEAAKALKAWKKKYNH